MKKDLERNAFSKRLKYKLLIIIIGIVILILFTIIDSFANEDDEQSEYNCYENKVAITFDDGPNEKTTSKLLDGLKERGVKATFFLIGESAEENPDIVRRISEEGHLIGSHTYTHVQLTSLPTKKAIDEIKKANDTIEEITGERPKYIRPPYGLYSEKLLGEVNMIPVLWSVDPNDWNTTNSAQIVKSVVSNVKCTDIILLHDIYPSSVVAALEIIDELKAKGYVFVTVDQILLD